MTYIPQAYDEWVDCITLKCGIPLTAEYIAARITALEDDRDFHTRKFIERWGKPHHARTLEWFRQAASQLAAR